MGWVEREYAICPTRPVSTPPPPSLRTPRESWEMLHGHQHTHSGLPLLSPILWPSRASCIPAPQILEEECKKLAAREAWLFYTSSSQLGVKKGDRTE